MNVLSLFSGVGGFDLGLEAAGMHTVGLCEIDANCRKVLRRHWPNVPVYEDVSTLTAAQLIADGVLPDLVAFGSPCQDLSVAGKRAGLAGSRSGLFGEALRIIRELREATHGEHPTWAIWENVPGALNSTRGDDFAAVLDSMADAGAVAIEWAVLDAQNFGVAQRRRRIFLVACFDARAGEQCPDPLLPVGQGSPRDPSTRRTAQEVAAAASGESAPPGGGAVTYVLDRASFNQGANAQYEPYIAEAEIMPSLVARGPHAVAYRMVAFGEYADDDTASALKARDYKDATDLIVEDPIAVRRLMPIECERLMGWPDDHTRWADDGTELADSHRYKMCGNGIASPVAEWVGRHVLLANAYLQAVPA